MRGKHSAIRFSRSICYTVENVDIKFVPFSTPNDLYSHKVRLYVDCKLVDEYALPRGKQVSAATAEYYFTLRFWPQLIEGEQYVNTPLWEQEEAG